MKSRNSAARPKKHILFVEDNEGISEASALFLEGEGYLLDCVSNGQEALDYLGTHPIPALILLNVEMPVMDGFQFREHQMRNPRISSIPVILMSAADPELASGYLARTHAQAYLQRPLDLDTLLAAVRRYYSN